MKWFEHWKEKRFQYYLDLGVRKSKLRFHQHGPDELAHYAKLAFDIQYEFPFGWKELEGIHNRTDYDLKRHTEFSGKDLTYLDEVTQRALHPVHHRDLRGADPHRARRALRDAYDEERSRGRSGSCCASTRAIAPITVGIFPLVKKDGLARAGARSSTTSCARISAPSTTRAGPSAAATAARTRSARRSASPWTTRPRRTRPSPSASATPCSRCA